MTPIAVLIAILVLGVASIPLTMGFAQVGTPPCKGTLANKEGSTWTLTCAGDCTGTNKCKSRSVTCNGTQMTACTCTSGNACPATNCCSVILDQGGLPTFFGDCPSCPGGGTTCRICPNNPETPTQYQPSCSACE